MTFPPPRGKMMTSYLNQSFPPWACNDHSFPLGGENALFELQNSQNIEVKNNNYCFCKVEISKNEYIERNRKLKIYEKFFAF